MMSLSCRTWFELTEVVCTVSSLPVGSGNSGSQLQLMDHKKQTVQCSNWLVTGGPDDVTELPDLVRAHRGSLYSQ